MSTHNINEDRRLCDQMEAVSENTIADFAKVVIHDSDGLISSISDNFSTLLAMDVQNLIGMSFYSTLDDSNKKNI